MCLVTCDIIFAVFAMCQNLPLISELEISLYHTTLITLYFFIIITTPTPNNFLSSF